MTISNITGLHISLEKFSIVGRELHHLTGTVKEAIYMSQAWNWGYGKDDGFVCSHSSYELQW